MSITYEKQKEKIADIKVIGIKSGKEFDWYAKIVFVDGTTLKSTPLLLNSASNRFPNNHK
jgi:hypothetical protein